MLLALAGGIGVIGEIARPGHVAGNLIPFMAVMIVGCDKTAPRMPPNSFGVGRPGRYDVTVVCAEVDRM